MGYYAVLKIIIMNIIAVWEKQLLLGNKIRKENFTCMIKII